MFFASTSIESLSDFPAWFNNYPVYAGHGFNNNHFYDVMFFRINNDIEKDDVITIEFIHEKDWVVTDTLYLSEADTFN